MDHSWGYASDQRLRDENQDCHGVFEFPDFTLAVVCDGMGGHVGGAQASAIAVRTVHDTMREHEGTANIHGALEDALTRANQAIYEAARKNHRLMGMGTTVVAAAITDDKAYLAHVGDSRAYLLRGGQVRQVTRDHTMVNLFVDAELLTPEDAATHPEAHVLSRSLGVERTVDVELTEPVELAPDDVLFLCSDGVHGVITDWELSNVDWGAPHEGIQHVMDIVAAREGDDNATALAVLLATSFEDVPPTPVPEPDRIGDGAGAIQGGYGGSGITAVPLDDDAGRTIIPDALADNDDVLGGPPPIGTPQSNFSGSQSSGPAPMAPPQSGGRDAGGYIVYDEEPEPAPVQVPDLRKRSRAEEAAATKAASSGGNRRGILLAALALLLIGGAGLTAAAVVGVSMTGGGGGAVEPPPLEPDPIDEPLVHIEGDGTDVDAAAMAEEDSDLFFKPRLPEAPRRLPHRPQEYTQPPPGGPAQWEAVQKARNHQCAESLDSVRRGMKASIDHATLYSQSWFCFNDVHQRPLADAELESWEDFPRLMEHFEGSREKRDELPDEIKRLPRWFQPPVDGIEYRLVAWRDYDEKDRMGPVMFDLIGAPTVADQLARDVLLEAQAAVALSKVEDPNDKVIDWWARRVFYATQAMNGRVGRLLEDNRPELIPVIEGLIEEATTEREPDETDPPNTRAKPVPQVVTDAWETAKGLRDKPDPKRVSRNTGPARPLEPDLEGLDLDPARVHRPGELVTESPK